MDVRSVQILIHHVLDLEHLFLRLRSQQAPVKATGVLNLPRSPGNVGAHEGVIEERFVNQVLLLALIRVLVDDVQVPLVLRLLDDG
jgi:hypothetical protein